MGEFPLLIREFPDDGLDVVEDLPAGDEFEFELMESVTFSKCAHLYNVAHRDPYSP
jgi:hypothetical protein